MHCNWNFSSWQGRYLLLAGGNTVFWIGRWTTGGSCWPVQLLCCTFVGRKLSHSGGRKPNLLSHEIWNNYQEFINDLPTTTNQAEAFNRAWKLRNDSWHSTWSSLHGFKREEVQHHNLHSKSRGTMMFEWLTVMMTTRTCKMWAMSTACIMCKVNNYIGFVKFVKTKGAKYNYNNKTLR